MYRHTYRQACLFILQLVTVTSKMTQRMGRTTSTELYRLCTSNNVVFEKLQIDRNQNRSLNYDPFPASQVCPKPKPKNGSYSQFTPKNIDTVLYRKWDCIWFLTKTLKRENLTNVTPTRGAYNSLITNILPVTIYCGLPLYPAPPTDWSNFYTALKLCQNISTATYAGGKTIISLDLQLYSKFCIPPW